ncbi:MAG: carboxypeptidase-like regulatory domain-containing protein, partial [Cellulophaga baltica]
MRNVLFTLLLLPLLSLGQRTTISGVVTDGSDVLPGVNILEKGTTNGVTTDFNGNFQISVASGAVLNFSYIGFKNQEVNTTDKTVLSIAMEEDAKALDEVVVQGFTGVVGRARKRTESIQSIPESVTALNSEGIEKNGINNVTN